MRNVLNGFTVYVYHNISQNMYEALFEFSELHRFCNGCISDLMQKPPSV